MQNLKIINIENPNNEFIESNLDKGVCVIGKFLLLEKVRILSKGKVSYKLKCTQIRTGRLYTIFVYNSELFEIEEGNNYKFHCFLNSAHGYFIVLMEYYKL